MSTDVNDTLLTEAHFFADYFEGTIIADAIRADIERSDLDALQFHVKKAQDQAFDEEYNPDESN